jgi:hypothetical protein
VTMAEMTPYLAAAAAVSGLNLLLLGALGVVWTRNYQTFRTPMTLGLMGFAAVLAVENLVALGFFLSPMAMLYASEPAAMLAVLVMRLLEFVALALLTYVSLQ